MSIEKSKLLNTIRESIKEAIVENQIGQQGPKTKALNAEVQKLEAAINNFRTAAKQSDPRVESVYLQLLQKINGVKKSINNPIDKLSSFGSISGE